MRSRSSSLFTKAIAARSSLIFPRLRRGPLLPPRGKRRAASLAIYIFAAIFLTASPAAAAGGKYFEIVREKPHCKTDACFVEFVVLSNGLAVRKQVDKAEEDAPATMRIGKIADPAALFAKTADFFKGANSAASRVSNSDNIFFYDGEKFYAYGSADADAQPYLSLFQDVEAAFSGSAPADDFYAHVYYTPVKGHTKDFHVFSDGTVIASMFGRDTYMIVYTFVSGTDAAEVAALRKLGAEAVKSRSSDYKKCAPATGIDFGFVEMRIDGGYIRAYSCGDEGDGAANLLNHIRATFDGLKPK